MATETSGSHPSGAAAEVKDKGEELVSAAQEQITSKANELGGDAMFQIREQLDQRSTQAGEQLQSIGKTLQSGANQLRSEGNDVPARIVKRSLGAPTMSAITSSPRRPTGSSATSRDSPEGVLGSRRA